MTEGHAGRPEKTPCRHWLSVVATVLVIGSLAAYVVMNRESFASIRVARATDLVLLGALLACRMTLRGVFQWQSMRALGAPVGFGEALKLCYAGLLLNQVLPLPVGAGYRAVYLRRTHQLPFEYFASTMAALFVFMLIASAAGGLIAIGLLLADGGAVAWPAATLLAGILGLCALLFCLPGSLQREGRIARRVSRVLAGWRVMSRSPSLLLTGGVVVAGSMAVSVLAMLVAFSAFGHSIGGTGSLLLMSSQRAGSLVRITPGAIGAQELVSVYFASMLTVTTAQTLVVLGTVRVTSLVVGAILGVPSMLLIARRGRAGADA